MHTAPLASPPDARRRPFVAPALRCHGRLARVVAGTGTNLPEPPPMPDAPTRP